MKRVVKLWTLRRRGIGIRLTPVKLVSYFALTVVRPFTMRFRGARPHRYEVGDVLANGSNKRVILEQREKWRRVGVPASSLKLFTVSDMVPDQRRVK